ncbi:hypothetical protein C0Q70_02986 [Pomacea canaliculata]|uniref:Cubilin n=1 Tax=Pomacea canaliculata TaxID=400727 RepID=A0A2T7PRG1_POMCA|nr:hypothetical protein C0Q70_02986 [Pomacea canaliculata]
MFAKHYKYDPRAENDVRLVDGPNPYEGRLEVFKGGVWLSVCNSNGAVLYNSNSYGQAPGEILKKRINCYGQEASLSNCTFTPQDQNCDPVYTLGVSCDTGLSTVQTVRLVNGTSQYEGRVEVFKAGVWGSVTDTIGYAERPLRKAIAANVVCRGLFGTGFGGSIVPKGEATLRFGVARRRAIHMTYVRCEGNEESLLNCSYSDVWYLYESLEDSLAVICKPVPNGCNVYIESPNGTLSSPELPESAVYNNNTDCVWTIVSKSDKIQMSVTTVLINSTLNPSLNTLQIKDSDAAYTLAYIQGPTTVRSSGKILYVWLKAQSGTKGIQFQASWDVPPCFQQFSRTYDGIQSPKYPSQYPPNMNCTYQIFKRKGVFIRFVFYDFALEDPQNNVCQDSLQIFDGDSETSPTVGGPLCGTSRPADIMTSIQNSTMVLVRFRSDAVNTTVEKGYNIYYYQVEPDAIRPGNYTADSGTLTSPGYPDIYKGEESVIWTITTKPYKTITLVFYDAHLSCCYDNAINVYDTNFYRGYDFFWYSTFSSIVSDGNRLEITLSSTFDNAVNKLNATWTTECRQVFRSTTGNITSPDDPDFNTSSAACTYIIRQETNNFIRLQFTAINLEKDQKCRNYLEVHDGGTELSPVLGEKFCGLSFPRYLISTQNMVFLKFSTQSGHNNFSLTYFSYPKDQWFGYFPGSISSPSDADFKTPPTGCGYILQEAPGYYISVHFSSISFEKDKTCRNYIEVHDGSTEFFPLIGERYCGTSLPPTLISTQNMVFIKFSSQIGVNNFTLNYASHRKECDKGLMTDSEGSFTSPGFPLGYPSNTYCVWTISVNKAAVIDLTFDDFSVGALGGPCQYAFVRVYDGPMVDASRVMTTLCGTTLPPKLRSTGSSLTVVLNVFGSLVNANGFRASYIAIKPNGFYPYGVTANDGMLGASLYDAMTVWFPDDGFPFGESQQEFVSVGRNGIVSFEKGIPWPRLDSSRKIVCAYCTYINNEQSVYYHVYTDPVSDRAVLDKATYDVQDFTGSATFQASAVIVVTWDRVQQYFPSVDYKPTNMGDATFQVALVTDWFNSYALLQYRVGHMNWRYPGRWYTIEMGVAKGFMTTFRPNVYSGTELAYVIDNYYGNTGYKGYWIYELGKIPTSYSKICKDWYRRNKKLNAQREVGFAALPKCPCSRRGIFRGIVNQWRFHRRDEQNYFECFILNVARTGQFAPFGKARTQRAELRPGTPTNGTVFTAVGAEENGVRVFLQIDPNTNTTLIVYVNGTDYTTRFSQEGNNFTVDNDDVMLTRDNDTCVVSFPSGISLQIYIRMKALVIGIAMPRNFQNLTKGLLGNFNGDRTDDFILPSGEQLNNSLSERQIFNLFGRKWLVNTNNSVMRYEARMGPADFYRQDFQPVFLDELDPSRLTQAKVLCGDTNMPCIYDFLATGDRNFAFQTSDLRNLSDILIQQSKNTAPVLQVPDVVHVTVNVSTVFGVTGIDPDVTDRLTYHLMDAANGSLSINQSSGAVTVNLRSLSPIHIQVYVVDFQGAQSPVVSVPIVACSGCSGHGTCNMSDTRDVLGDHDFQFAVCRCGPAWAGDNCELDRDGCSDSPCHPLRNCTDIPASQQGASDIGYVCSSCPQGFFMRNSSRDCYDVDECSDITLHGCAMLCVNTYGSYECSCQEGYRLSTNGHSCDDVNECVERTHDCQQICNNTAGGFQCECEAGYTYDTASKSCIAIFNFSQVCTNSNCSQGCRVMTDAANISHAQCFCYLGYDLDPRDNVTCVDRDECRDKVCDQVCNNTAGGFSCSCYDGFALNKDERTCSACPYLKYGPECRETCTCSGRSVACHPVRGCVCQDGWTGTTCMDDVDECVENPDVCGLDQTCVNNRGSYSCVCRSGYATNDSGVCQDINECAINRGDCQHDCVNVLGSFNCECKYGYRLNADRKTCSLGTSFCCVMFVPTRRSAAKLTDVPLTITTTTCVSVTVATLLTRPRKPAKTLMSARRVWPTVLTPVLTHLAASPAAVLSE